MAIIRTNGFVQLRRGLQEHVSNGSMSVVQLGIYCLILMNADPATGIWVGSAGLISSLSGQSPRTCRDAFERLEESGYIKRFAVQGKHGSYPILVHRFECSDGAMKGKRLNALKTDKCSTPTYESRHDDGDDNGNEHVNDDGNERAAKYIDNKRNDKREIKPSRAARTSDSRHTPFRDALEAYWAHKNPNFPEMPWEGRDAKALAALLAATPDLTLEKFKLLLNNRARSHCAHGDRVYLWIAKATSYSEPLNQFNKPEVANGKAGNAGAAGRFNRNIENLKTAIGSSGDYAARPADGQNMRILPAPGDEP